jgi:hypothetical protein
LFDETSFGETLFDEMLFGEMLFDETSFGKKLFEETSFGEKLFGERAFEELPWYPNFLFNNRFVFCTYVFCEDEKVFANTYANNKDT